MRALIPLGQLLSLLSALVLCSCGGPKTTNLAPSPTEKTIENIPDWFLNLPSDPNYLFATGSMTSKDMQMSLNKAKTTAQTDLAQQLESKVGNLTKQFQEEVGVDDDSELLQQFTSVTKVVTSQTLNGVRVDQQKLVPEKGIYRAYVLMSLPIGEANQLLMDKIKANQQLYTRFRATQAFEELDQELKALEGK